MSTTLAKKVEGVYLGARSVGRIGLSDFSHGRKWRDDLENALVLEIVDRTDTAGWLVSGAGMDSIMEHIARLEDELEEANVRALIAAREGRSSWKSGSELAEAAKKSARVRKQQIEEAARASKR